MKRNRAHINDVALIKTQLLIELPRLIEWLFAGRTTHCTAHEIRVGTHGSICIRVTDGRYFNHETGEGGDVLTLIQHVLRMDFKGALVWARGFVGNHHAAR